MAGGLEKGNLFRRMVNLTLNIIATMAMASGFLPMLSWSRLEGVPVPNHFNIHGVVDGVGDRGILLTLALVGLGFYIIMILAQCFPQLINLPVPAHRESVAKDVKRDLAAQLNLLITLLFSFGANSTLSVAAGNALKLDMRFILADLVLILLCIGVAVFRIYRK